jgi:hypothetical protein
MRQILPLACLLLMSATPLQAQPAPFDMSPENGGANRPAPVVRSAPKAREQTAPNEPSPAAPGFGSAPAAGVAPPRPTPSTEPTPIPTTPVPADAGRTAGSPPAADPPSVETPKGPAFRRYLLPMDDLTLSGETATRTWSVFLTAEQAAAGPTLHVGYQSAIFVAPETSRLTVSINETQILDEAVSSPGGVKELAGKVPVGLLRAGFNVISFAVSLRHRTDCTIASTYDIWADIDPARSFLEFPGVDTGDLRRVDDLGAVGVDVAGQTTFNLIVPPGDLAPLAGPMLRLSQGLAMLANMPNQDMVLSQGAVPEPANGELTVLAGPAAEIGALAVSLPPLAGEQPTLGFVKLRQHPGSTALVVTGPAWKDVEAAIERLLSPIDRPLAVHRSDLSSPSWRMPDAPLFLSGGTVSFADLGVPTQEFSGRRFRTEFAVGIAADFYAQAYGKATILLDGAYTGQVLPGSHFDIYVNGDVATTLPIGSSGGAVLRDYPVQFTMRHFKPGINQIAIETILLTADDTTCLPGSNAAGPSRFAIFGTSQLSIPDFARISSRPNLVPMQGVAYPYNRAAEPIPLMLAAGGADGAEVLSAAGTLLAKMSVAAGRPIPFEIQSSAATAAAKDALFVGIAQAMPPGVLAQVGVSEASRTNWGLAAADPGAGGSGEIIAKWQEEYGEGGWRRPLAMLRNWLKDSFDISPAEIRLAPSSSVEFVPGAEATLLVAQGDSPEGDKVWTAFNAPTAAELSSGIKALTRNDGWSQLGNSVTTYASGTGLFTQAPGGAVSLVQSQPFSIANMRLVAANWLSENVLSYAGLLGIMAVLLGLASTAFASVLGRRK